MQHQARVFSMAILLVSCVNEEGKEEVLAIEPMLKVVKAIPHKTKDGHVHTQMLKLR